MTGRRLLAVSRHDWLQSVCPASGEVHTPACWLFLFVTCRTFAAQPPFFFPIHFLILYSTTFVFRIFVSTQYYHAKYCSSVLSTPLTPSLSQGSLSSGQYSAADLSVDFMDR